MARILDKEKVRAWLRGQDAAARQIRSERTAFLLSLTPEQALKIYLGLKEVSTSGHPERPSPLTLAMRQAIARLDKARERL